MLQSFPVQDVKLHVITVFKNDLVKCLIALIYTNEMFKFRYVGPSKMKGFGKKYFQNLANRKCTNPKTPKM